MRALASTRLPRLCAAIAHRIACRQEGVAAVEFALILPILVFMLIGTVEISQALTVDRRVTQVASSTADLVARGKTVTKTELDGMMQIIGHLVKPYKDDPLKLSVLNVIADVNDNTKTTVCWSYSYDAKTGTGTPGTGSHAKGTTYTLPSGIVGKGESAIVAEVTYDYDATVMILQYFIKSAFKMQETFYLKPRLSLYVEYEGEKC
jgi:Flp pilus assembly protein TadG